MVSIPISVRDVSGTSLGSDAGGGNRIKGFAFKIMFPTNVVASVTFARAGATALATPLYETTLDGSGFGAFVVSFSESSHPIGFTLNAAAPGNQIGTLTVSLQPSLPVATTATLILDPPSAMLSNQAGSVRETVENGNLALVNGSVTVSAAAVLATPSNLAASAINTSQVNLGWVGVAGANHYEIWRSSGGRPYAVIGTSAGTASSDSNVVAGTTYLYRVRAVDGSGGASALGNIDAATMILFTDDPLVATTTIIKAVHLTELRMAVNAMRVAANLLPLAPDGSVAVGATVLASHIADLRAALNAGRTTAGLAELMFTDPSITAGTTVVKAAHAQELRDGVK